MVLDIVKPSLLEFMNLLVHEQYDAAIGHCGHSRLTSRDVRFVIEQYGRHLILPPPELWHTLDAVQVRGATSPTWSVRVPCWTIEEGRSDLEFEMTILISSGIATIELDDLRVP